MTNCILVSHNVLLEICYHFLSSYSSQQNTEIQLEFRFLIIFLLFFIRYICAKHFSLHFAAIHRFICISS